MQSLFSMEFIYTSRSRLSGAVLLLTAAAGLAFLTAPPQARAAVFASGDILPQQEITNVFIGGELVTIWGPNLPSAGGRLTEDDGMGGTTDSDLIVGGTGEFSGLILEDGTKVGTTTGLVTINNPTGTLPLIAANITIGQFANGVGRISLNDFGTTMIADLILTIGEEGQGELRITNGSRVNVGEYNETEFRYENGETIIGSLVDTSGTTQFISEGIVIMDGFGTLLETDELIVADEGLATVELSGKANLVTLSTIIGESSGSLGQVSLTGLGTRWDNVEFVSGGGADAGKIILGDSGSGILDINDQAVVAADVFEINTTSFVNLGGGMMLANDKVDTDGVIRGYGRIESDLMINGSGELRNKANVDNIREYLYVTGDVTNSGTIESIGGEMEFESPVTNSLEIIARDAILRFTSGLTNDGTLSLGGDTTIHGDITGVGDIHILTDSAITIVGDITFTAASILSLSVGDAPGTLDVIGSVDMSGALIDLNYSAGVMSQTGDSYQILQANGGITGYISPSMAIADGFLWEITQPSSTTLIATRTGSTPMPFTTDLNGDGIVNGLDLAIWEANFPTFGGTPPVPGDTDGDGDVDGFDFLRIQRDLGGAPMPAIVAASAVVPEPSSVLLLIVGSLMIGTGSFSRKRS